MVSFWYATGQYHIFCCVLLRAMALAYRAYAYQHVDGRHHPNMRAHTHASTHVMDGVVALARLPPSPSWDNHGTPPCTRAVTHSPPSGGVVGAGGLVGCVVCLLVSAGRGGICYSRMPYELGDKQWRCGGGHPHGIRVGWRYRNMESGDTYNGIVVVTTTAAEW